MFLLLAAIEDEDDRDYISQLYEQYYPIMKKKAYDITQDYNIVDDLINDSFIKLIDKISVLRSLDCCKRASYIVHTIRNVSFNYVKHRKMENSRTFFGESEDLVDSVPDTAATAEEIYLKQEEYRELGEAIDQLSDRDKELLYNKYNLELSDPEISELMGIPVNNIREYLVRAKRRALKKMEGIKSDKE